VVLNALLIIFPPDTVNWGLPLTYPNLWSLAWSSSMLVTFLVTMFKQVRRLSIEEPVHEHTPAPLGRGPWLESDGGWLPVPQTVVEPVAPVHPRQISNPSDRF
jgi:hypothetical protein